MSRNVHQQENPHECGNIVRGLQGHRPLKQLLELAQFEVFHETSEQTPHRAVVDVVFPALQPFRVCDEILPQDVLNNFQG